MQDIKEKAANLYFYMLLTGDWLLIEDMEA